MITVEEIKENVKSIVYKYGDIFKHPQKISCDDVIFESGFDSITCIRIIVEIEEEFGIEFEDDMLSLKESINDISEYVYIYKNLAGLTNT